ncbi:hypothetical protein ACTJJB_01590 [Chitinophaga sp. 22536]|uniref:hypothetical protein n=1 Tax=unclassified Chitinophaga TaxID=2619133 RepID=UPI003F8521E7
MVHLQLAYQEAIAALGQCLAGAAYNPSKVYVLNGCVNSGSGTTYNISAGSVFYNGEVYLVDAASFTISGPNVAVGIVPNPPTVTTGLSFYSDVIADPVQFTDGVNRNVHQIRKCVIQPGLSGSGAANYNDFIDITRRIQGGVGDIKIWKWPSGNYSDYFDVSGAGIHPYTVGWHDCNGQGGAIDMRGRTTFGWDAAQAEFTTPFNSVGGQNMKALIEAEMPAHTHTYERVGSGTGTSNFLGGGTFNPAGTPLPTSSKGLGQPFSMLNPYRAVLWVQRLV